MNVNSFLGHVSFLIEWS